MFLGYLDPGSGSFLFQILIAGLLAAVYGTKSFWSRLISSFRKKKEPPHRK